MRRAARWLAAGLAAGALQFGLAGMASANGALALDENQGRRWGWAVDYPSMAAAESHALRQCGPGCAIVMRFGSGCAAYAADQARGSTIYGWGTNTSASSAQSRALSECQRRGGRQCTVRVWGCNSTKTSSPGRSPYPAPAPAPAPHYDTPPRTSPPSYNPNPGGNRPNTGSNPSPSSNQLVVDANHCLRIKTSNRGQQCNSRRSMRIELVNTCSTTISAQLCVYRMESGRFVCGANSNMRPGETVSQSQCNTDGRYKYFGCTKRPGAYGNCGGNQG